MTRDEVLDQREDVLEEFDDKVDPSHGPPTMTSGELRWFTAQLLADEIVRLRTRVAWLENEIDLIDGIATAATGLMNAPLDGRELYIRKVIDAARTYRDGSLDDDGTEP